MPLFRRSYRYCLVNSSLALLHGQDVFNTYSSFCENPHKVYQMSVSEEDYITEAEFEVKVNTVGERRRLKICYVGRAVEMKGPTDWLKTVHELISSGVEITATWVGDGPSLPSMAMMTESLGIARQVKLTGYIFDRREIFRILREADLFLFCHQTPESPRCLVEALVSGCPLIGYSSAFTNELVAQCGGGLFAPVGHWKELSNIVKTLNDDRSRLRDLMTLARASGRLYDRDRAMQHRIDLIKESL